jgi:hypothetical protein
MAAKNRHSPAFERGAANAGSIEKTVTERSVASTSNPIPVNRMGFSSLQLKPIR